MRDVKKALECCYQSINMGEAECSKCPYNDVGCDCIECLEIDALDYIRQLEKQLAITSKDTV